MKEILLKQIDEDIKYESFYLWDDPDEYSKKKIARLKQKKRDIKLKLLLDEN